MPIQLYPPAEIESRLDYLARNQPARTSKHGIALGILLRACAMDDDDFAAWFHRSASEIAERATESPEEAES